MDIPHWVRSSIRVSSTTLSGNEVTAILGLTPTRVVEAGDRLSPKNPRSMIADATVWVLDSHQPENALMSDHIQALVDLVEARESGFLQAVEAGTIDFFIGFTAATGQSTDQARQRTALALKSFPDRYRF